MTEKKNEEQCADKARKAKKNYLSCEEKVYLINVVKENRLTSNYDPTPH